MLVHKFIRFWDHNPTLLAIFSFLLYRWEVITRKVAILGISSCGWPSIKRLLYFPKKWFREPPRKYTHERKNIYRDLTLLGGSSDVPTNPDEAVLEKVANPQVDNLYSARFTIPEFTSLCPLTGQPDFAHLVVDYVPEKWLVESKSLKLYLGAFRNHGAFHEDCTVSIALKLKNLLAPVGSVNLFSHVAELISRPSTLFTHN